MSELGDELKIGNFKNIITDYVAEHGEIAGMYREPRGAAAPRSPAWQPWPPTASFPGGISAREQREVRMSSTVDGCLDEAWCEEGQRDRHAKQVSLMLRISHFKAEWSRSLDNLTLVQHGRRSRRPRCVGQWRAPTRIANIAADYR
jgi:hypothetical protein